MARYGRRAATVVLAVIFAGAGLAKLVAPAMFHDQFEAFGLPPWFVFATAAVELLGAALVAFTGGMRRRSGAVLLACAMAVASFLHVLHDPLAMSLPAFALLLLAAYVALSPSRRTPGEAVKAA
jgi:uncharacterized membrane protein YphA (DoxX/SURF4 family)